ncbi:MAG: hypothetical protein ABW123_17680 [Cystobacter sp.]
MSRRSRSLSGPLLTCLLLPLSSLALPWDSEVTNVPASERYPRPTTRIDNHRQLIAREEQGGWRTYLGDLHAHSRGHGLPGQATPNIRRDEVNLSAWYFGYDFIATTNHATSWKLYDQLAPLYRTLTSESSSNSPDLLALKGVESYAGPGNVAHFNAFNRLVILDTDSLTVWHNAIIALYAKDPTLSTHIQLNHPEPEDPWFQLPSELDPGLRRIVRDAVEVAEYKGMHGYFELLRRGFRVSPVSNTDSHASFDTWRIAGGAAPARRAYLQEPGIPPEKWKGEETGGRAGVVLPASEPFSYENFLRALRERRTFHTSVAAASGFFVANGHPMGSEFTLGAGEQRLDFTIWGTTRLDRSGIHGWRRLELWSPFHPDAPLRVIDFGSGGPVDLKQLLSVTPYESIYVIRLERERPGAEVVLAPIWITNPRPPPTVSLAPMSLSAWEHPCLDIQGGGESLLLQRADSLEASGWRTVASLSPGTECHPLDVGDSLEPSQWRVVDALQEEVVSNTVVIPAGAGAR